ncbi:MAG: sodium:solute symporter, partial [Phycisphaeraceae bacterium]|nr:sodium:solute symporter [Phycisphaeraceae bacterium]
MKWIALIGLTLCLATVAVAQSQQVQHTNQQLLQWNSLPPLPDAIGVAGPVVGVHNDALIVGGGANFPTAEGQSIWDASKVWHDDVYVLIRDAAAEGGYRWLEGYK